VKPSSPRWSWYVVGALFLVVVAGMVLALVLLRPREILPGGTSSPQVVHIGAVGDEFVPATVHLQALRQVRLEVVALESEIWVDIPGVVGPTRIPSQETRKIVFTPAQLGLLELRNLNKPGVQAKLIVQPSPPEALEPNPVPPTPESGAAGRAVYSRYCLPCHGESGRGDGPAIPRAGLRPADFTAPFMADIADGEMFWVISEGWAGMPSFKSTLGATERWNLVNYLRTFARPRS